MITDGILGTFIESSKKAKDIMLESKPPKDCIELKPYFNVRPHKERLGEEFSEDKTLRQILIEGLSGTDNIESRESKNGENAKESKEISECEILDIIDIGDCRKFFKKYICLFYKNISDEERILVINERLDIDKDKTEDFSEINKEATLSFNTLIESSNFETQENQGSKKNMEKFNELNAEKIQQIIDVDLADGKTIETQEHKRYFKYVLKNAKQKICIQSPWIRNHILDSYKDDIKGCLERCVKLFIKYGLKPKNRFDKVGIDEKSKIFFNELKKKYSHLFSLQQDNDHSKIIICDDDFMIIGSFNWLSFGGEKDKDDEIRNEVSNINRNKEAIKKQQDKFK